MILASPKSQDEYARIRSLLSDYRGSWHEAVIAGYRLELDGKEWVDTDEKLKYNIDWEYGEPNNAEGRENCLSKFDLIFVISAIHKHFHSF